MPPEKTDRRIIHFAIATIWIVATLALAAFFPMLEDDDPILFGMPWIVAISILCQASIFGLFVFISKYMWKIEKEAET